MSELYSVSVVAASKAHVDLAVTVVHPDAGGVSDDLSFAFRLLYDPFLEYSLKDDAPVKGAPLGKEMDLDDYLRESFIAANAAGFVASSELIAEENHPPPNYGDPGYDTFWDSGEPSTGTLRITPTHPAWIAHFAAGMTWDTAAYGSWDAESWEGRPTRRPGDHVEEVSDDPMAGMHTRGSDDARMKGYVVEHLERDTYVLVSAGAAHYTTKETLSGDALTVEAVRGLLGEPVKIIGGWHGQSVGTIISVDDSGSFQVYQESSGSYGTSGFDVSNIESIGRAWYVSRVAVEDVDV